MVQARRDPDAVRALLGGGGRPWALGTVALGLALLVVAIVLPFYGWGGLQTQGPALALIGGAGLVLVPGRRDVALGAGLVAVWGLVLIVVRLASPPTNAAPVLQAVLRFALSPGCLWLAAAGAALVVVTAIWTTHNPSVLVGVVRWPRWDLGQKAAWAVTWRAVLGSRVLVWAAGIAGVAIIGAHAHLPGGPLTRPFGTFGNTVIAPGSAWDSGGYLAIAEHGYASGYYFDVFFPLYPLLIRLGAWSPQAAVITGIATSVALLAVALYLLHRLVALDFDDGTATLTVVLVAFFPTALFFSAVYSESLFLALSVGAFYAGRRGWWARAGILGGLACASRINGLVLLVPLALLYLHGPGPLTRSSWQAIRERKVSWDAAYLLLLPAGVLVFLAYMGAHGGWLSPLHAEKAFWGRTFSPLQGLTHGVRDGVLSVRQLIVGRGQHILTTTPTGGFANPITLAKANLIDLAFLVLGLVCTVGAVRRLPVAYWAYAVTSLAFTVSTVLPIEPLGSQPRYLAVLFPCQIWLALWIGDNRSRRVLIPISIVLLALFASMFARGAWVA